MEDNKKHSIISIIVRAGAGSSLLIAIADWPYTFYQFNRVLVFAAALYLVWYLFEEDKIWWAIAIGLGGLIFNPIAPLTLEQSTWRILDLLFGLIFLSSVFFTEKESDSFSVDR